MGDARVQIGSLHEPHSAPPTGPVQRIVMFLQRALRPRAAAKRSLRRIETLPLGPRKCVHLVECGGQYFLLADGLSAPVQVAMERNEAGR